MTPVVPLRARLVRYRWWLLGAVAIALGLAFGAHAAEHALFGLLRRTQQVLLDARDAAPMQFIAAYFIVYVATAAVSLPVAGVLTLAAGAVFGFWWGLLLAAVSASTGALAGFLVSRYLFHSAVEKRFGARLAPIHQGLREEGSFYLFALRMVPVFPYWLVNLLMGLTSMRALRFWWVSGLGMLPLEAAYVFAGTRLASISRPRDVFSFDLFAALVALAVLPLLLRRLVRWAEHRYFRHED